MLKARDNYTLTMNAVLNGIAEGFITNSSDVLYYVSGYNKTMTAGELVNLIDELKKCGKIVR